MIICYRCNVCHATLKIDTKTNKRDLRVSFDNVRIHECPLRKAYSPEELDKIKEVTRC